MWAAAFVHEGKSVIVAPFLRPQLQKNADLCNCWAFLSKQLQMRRAFVIFLFFEGENNKETGIYVIFVPIFLEK